MLTTIRNDRAFELSGTDGERQNKISGVLHVRDGKFLLDISVAEPGMTDTYNSLPLQIGKPWTGGPVASFVFMRVITLRRHEPRLQQSSARRTSTSSQPRNNVFAMCRASETRSPLMAHPQRCVRTP
jgi:hypothetical protein